MTLIGTLHDMPLSDLFEIFRTSNKSGVLKLAGETHQGTIYVSLGRLVDAQITTEQQQPLAVGDAAVLHMMRWGAAEFSFSHSPAALRRPVTIFHSSEQLLELHGQQCSPDELALPVAPASAASQHSFNYQLDDEARRARSAMRRPARVCGWAEQAPAPSYQQRSAAASRRCLDLMPCEETGAAALAHSPSAAQAQPKERAVGEEYQPAAQPVRRSRTWAAQPASPLLQAVMRRVRCL